MKISILSVFILLFSACVSPQDPNESTADVPLVFLTQDSVQFQGTAGAYCYDEACEDKTIVPTLVQNIDFQNISKDEFSVKLEKAATEIRVGMLDTEGVQLLCYIEVKEVSQTEYNLNLCGNGEGQFILEIRPHYENGEIPYFFPLQGY